MKPEIKAAGESYQADVEVDAFKNTAHKQTAWHSNKDRLWNTLMSMAEIGATEKGGCNRQALTELDKQGRDLFINWCKDAGCEIKIDEIGNIFARRPGLDNSLPAVITGSHLDTQPTGGKFDGVYGVLAGLECIRTMNEYGIRTMHPVEVVVWTNEEGARFNPACMGSGVWTDMLSLEDMYEVQDAQGVSVKQALEKIGYLGEEPAVVRPIKAAFEAHIEQGPILEKEKKQIGIVTGIQGVHWFTLDLFGVPCHAGPTPMESRKDPVLTMVNILNSLYKMTTNAGLWARCTVGEITTWPGSPNTVPERVSVRIDLRHPLPHVWQQMAEYLKKVTEELCQENQIRWELTQDWRVDVTRFDDNCIAQVKHSVDALGYAHMEMVSGAGHDSLYLSRVVPTSMIFVPCENGISHNEAENAELDDLHAGTNVLLNTLLSSAVLQKQS